MNISIIGSGKSFIEGEIIQDVTKAEIILFSKNINYRSATTKFNKLTSKQLVITFNNNIEFFKKYYNFTLIPTRSIFTKSTNPVIISDKYYTEAILDITNTVIPDTEKIEEYRVVKCSSGLISFNGNYIKTPNEANHMYGEYHNIVTLLKTPDRPALLIIQLDLYKIPDLKIVNLINNYICELIHSL